MMGRMNYLAARPRSLRHRAARRRLSPYVWGVVPVISPYADRLMAAANDGHVCRPFLTKINRVPNRVLNHTEPH